MYPPALLLSALRSMPSFMRSISSASFWAGPRVVPLFSSPTPVAGMLCVALFSPTPVAGTLCEHPMIRYQFYNKKECL